MLRPRRRHVLPTLALLAATAGFGWVLSARAQQPADPAVDGAAPNQVELHRTRGVIAWKQAVWVATPESLDEPLLHLERALTAGGNDIDFTVGFLLGYSYLLRDQRATALQLIEAGRRALPDFVGYALLDGMRLEDEGRHAESAEALAGFLARDEEIAAVPVLADEFRFLGHLHRGQALLGDARNDEAMVELERALEISQESSRKPSAAAKVLLARAHVAAEQFPVAEALLLEVVAAAPDDPLNYYHLGVIYADQKQEAKARHWYSLAVKHRPGFARAYIKLAFLARADGDLDGCRRHLERYAALTKGDASRPPTSEQIADVASGFGHYWSEVGNARTDAQDPDGARLAYDEAIRNLRRALQERPFCKSAITLLIQLLYSRGDDTQAERDALTERLREMKDAELSDDATSRSTFC